MVILWPKPVFMALHIKWDDAAQLIVVLLPLARGEAYQLFAQHTNYSFVNPSYNLDYGTISQQWMQNEHHHTQHLIFQDTFELDHLT